MNDATITDAEKALIESEGLKTRRVRDEPRVPDSGWFEVRMPLPGNGQYDHLTVDLFDGMDERKWTLSLCGHDQWEDPHFARLLSEQLVRAADLCDRLNALQAI